MERLDNPFHAEFSSTPFSLWLTSKSNYPAGEVRSAGGAQTGAGNYTFVRIYDAGYVAQILTTLHRYLSAVICDTLTDFCYCLLHGGRGYFAGIWPHMISPKQRWCVPAHCLLPSVLY